MSESPSVQWALATQGLHRRFGRRAVIRGLDLRVPPGVVYGFLGRNGAGKTTTIRMLMGMLPPHQGQLTVGGITGPRVTAAARAKVGYVSQEQHFYEWMTVRELARFVGGFYPTWRPDVLDGLLERLHIEAKQPVGELSGGTKMKLAMALALAHEPRTLILDEPTAGVDPIARREILELLRAQATQEGRTVFFSTHHIAEVEEVGDWVGILHEGRMLYQGPVADLARWIRKVDVAPEGPFKVLLARDDGLVVLGRPDDWETAPVAHRPVSLDEAFYAVAREVG
ncbi:MAG: ABC transporter ATP-binding protein [Myxococcales bacterium]|nr:ABC transporter ATP-binding protein [Myxococcales bacterium]